MSQKILIDGSSESNTGPLLSDHGLEDFEFESISKQNLKGNIYLGKVLRIEASLQAAFVDIGSEKNGFLAFGEIHPNYFQIPVADREALIQAEAEIESEHLNDEYLNDEQSNSNDEVNDIEPSELLVDVENENNNNSDNVEKSKDSNIGGIKNI